jgi:hypothetical protein
LEIKLARNDIYLREFVTIKYYKGNNKRLSAASSPFSANLGKRVIPAPRSQEVIVAFDFFREKKNSLLQNTLLLSLPLLKSFFYQNSFVVRKSSFINIFVGKLNMSITSIEKSAQHTLPYPGIQLVLHTSHCFPFIFSHWVAGQSGIAYFLSEFLAIFYLFYTREHCVVSGHGSMDALKKIRHSKFPHNLVVQTCFPSTSRIKFSNRNMHQ